MSYELLLLPVPGGADVEECGEALAVRLAGGHIRQAATEAAETRRRSLAGVVQAADPELHPDESGAPALADGRGIRVEVTESYALIQIAYDIGVAGSADAFERVFRTAAALAGETGWQGYDPQGATTIAVDDAGRDATLEIYLSVLDQLVPGSTSSAASERSTSA